MDSSGSSMSSLGTAEATQLLKDILNVGKQRSSATASETSTASLASNVKEDVDNTRSMGNGNGRLGFSSFADSGLKTHSSGGESDHMYDVGLQHGHPGGDNQENTSQNAYSSSTDMDRSHSYHGDDADTSTNEIMPKDKVENGRASLTELLRTMSSEAALPKQLITLTGDDSENSFSVYGRDVEITSSAASGSITPAAGSNKVKINPVVNFDWEHKHYIGNLVAAHKNGVHVAYVLRGKSGGIVRVINRKTTDRALLRGFTGRVVDIAFAHLSPIVLGAVDEKGNMFIYEIMDVQEGKIETSLLLQVDRPPQTPLSGNHRLIWCPYIPEDEESSATTANTTSDSSVAEDIGKLLVLTHNEVAEMWNIDIVTREHGSGPMLPTDVDVGYLTINHTQAIIDASFSPDGTALATASLDGEVKFFQVYMHDKAPPRCLHEWRPHDGRPVSSLFFLDDHKHPNPEVQFWKFAITGADNNQEIKIWSCESWMCLQTIHIMPPLEMFGTSAEQPCIKAHIDLSANHLILSDITRKVLYIMQIYQDFEQSRSHVSSVSEFLLTQPCLSFVVVEASRRKFNRALENTDDNVADLTTGEVCDEDEEEVSREVEGPNIGVLVKMYSVHTRALQELQIRFKPKSSTPQPPAASMSSFSHDDTGFRDPLSDISMDTTRDSEVRTDRSQISHHVAALSEDLIQLGQDSYPSSTQTTPRDPSQVLSPGSSISDRVISAEEARAQAEAHLKELIKGAAPSQNQPMGSPSGLESQRPLLMTPDAFTAASRREPPSQALDSVRSSASSSFTQVTAMDDDQLRTPRGSMPVNQPSPGSSITLTPASSRDMSAGGSPHALGTPTSLPLPPPSPGEDAALSSTESFSKRGHPTLQDKSLPQSPSTPPRGIPPGSAGKTLPTNAKSQEFYTSSPASHKTQEFRPPLKSDSEIGETSSEALEEEFHTRVASQRQPLQSTGSSSSTSLEVLEILEGAKKPGQDIMYEEETDGECTTPQQDVLQPKDMQTREKELIEDPHVHRSCSDDEIPEESPRDSSNDQEDMLQAERQGKYDERIWPKPPDVQLQMEAQRLASEALQRAAGLQVGSENSLEPRSHDENDLDIEEGLGQVEGDVQIEEEKVEIIEEIENDEDGGEIIIHTHDRPSSGSKSHHPRQRSVEIPSFNELNESVQSMVGLLQTQQQEIEQLRAEIQYQRQTTDTVDSLQSHIANLESALASRLAGALTQHSESETQRLQQVLGERESQEQVKHDHLVSSLSKTLNTVLSAKLEKCVRDEIRQTVLPSVTKLVEPVKHQLHTDIAQKLTATDALMKENINKLVRSRPTIEAMGNAAGSALQGPVQAACRDVLVPSFDRACQNVCQQVNQTFQRGSQEYTHQLEVHMEQVRKRHEDSRDPIVHQLQAMVDAFKKKEEAHAPIYGQLSNVAETLQVCITAIQNSHSHMEALLQRTIASLQDTILNQVKTLIQEEVVGTLKEQQSSLSNQLLSAMRSQATTPVPPAPDLQQLQGHVLQLLKQGQLNSAFQQALSASNLKLVMFVCETVDASKIFNQTPCPLQQPVLLSLIQQLSAELNSNLELKHKYLEEALMNLDQTNAVTREHVPSVIGHLCEKLHAHLEAHPHAKMARQMKMLQMVAQSLLK